MRDKRKAPPGCYWRKETLWARFTIQGVEVRRSLSTGDVKLAAARYAKLKEEETAARKFGEARTTWGQAVVSWSSAVRQHTKPMTAKRYAVSLKQIGPFLMDLYVDQIDKTLIAHIIGKRQAAGLTNATIRRDLVALSSVLSHCEDQGWRDDNPALLRLKKLKERRDPIELPEPAHVEAVIAKAPGNFKHIIRAAWLTGCRLDELQSLKRRQLDFARGQVSLYRTKNGKVRVIDMRGGRAVFEAVPAAQTTDAVFWHGRDMPDSPAAGYLNVSSNFRRLVAAAQKSAHAATGAKASFRPFRFHDLRHLFAVEFLRAGGGIYDLSKHLGHSSVKVTEIYLDFLTADESAAARKG